MGLLDKLFDAPEHGWLVPKPRPPTPGLHLPPGAFIPDYKIYKLENAPELQLIEKRLAARGLKSPWLRLVLLLVHPLCLEVSRILTFDFLFGRNEVWRYNRKIWGSEAFRRADFVLYGWKYAFPMLVATAIYEVYFNKDSHGHGHGDHGHEADGHH